MGKINFIRGLIGEKLSLGAQFDLNWEDENFKRPNLIFTKSIDRNQGQNHKKIRVLGSNWQISQSRTNMQKTSNYRGSINWNRG